MKKSGAEIIVEILKREGITTVAGIPGGSNLPLYHALGKSGIRHILTRHEQAAGFLAQGMARTSGEVAVCMATSGPGVTNLLTAIADAKLDSIPIVAITGQVPSGMIGTDAFQEIDTYGLSLPLVKHSVMVKSPEELLVELPKAFRLARSGRPGPVVVDVPKDVQSKIVEFEAWPEAQQRDPDPSPDFSVFLSALTEELNHAEKPVILAGAGSAISNNSANELRRFAENEGIPVSTTLLALGAIPAGHPLNIGMLGMHGTRCANSAIKECDLLISIGARFDDRATGKLDQFAPNARIVHIDIDPAEIGKLVRPVLSIVSDAGAALQAINTELAQRAKPDRTHWLQHIQSLKDSEDGPDAAPLEHPVLFLRELSKKLDADSIVVTDVGQHQMWAAQAIDRSHVRSFLTSGGLGTMGFGLPTAIGAAVQNPDKQVVCITGDGSLLMNIQEFDTIAELGINITVILMDNGELGLVKQQQELFYEGQKTASHFYNRPNFAAIARGFGLQAFDSAEGASLDEVLAAKGAVIYRVETDPEAMVYPMVPPGAANTQAIGSYNSEESAEEESA